MKPSRLFLLFLMAAWGSIASAQQVSPFAYYTDSEGQEIETLTIDDGQAPLDVEFRANASDTDGHLMSYEWHFRKMDQQAGLSEFLVRYEENTQYTFTQSGTYNVVLRWTADAGTEQEVADSTSLMVTILESKLEFPNAFSPNGDGINDIYKAKDGWQSIVDFHAYIFNRSGHKLYEWTDPAGGWDGKVGGRDVSDGVYYVLVKAKGADGHNYHIRKDVNLLRGYIETSGAEQ